MIKEQHHILFEWAPQNKRPLLIEASHNCTHHVRRLGVLLNEGTLSSQQLTQLFQNLAQDFDSDKQDADAPDVDPRAKTSVKQFLSNLWSIFQNSARVKGFDQAVEKQLQKLQQWLSQSKTGQRALDILKKYRSLGKRYPILQGLILAVLAILAGMTGLGPVGLGLLLAVIKGVNALLMGDRASDAVRKAAIAAAVGYSAGLLRDFLVMKLVPVNELPTPSFNYPTTGIDSQPVPIRDAYNTAFAAARKAGNDYFVWIANGKAHVSGTLLKSQAENMDPEQLAQYTQKGLQLFKQGNLPTVNFDDLKTVTLLPNSGSISYANSVNEAASQSKRRRPIITESNQWRVRTVARRAQYVTLTESEVNLVLEGIWDRVKGWFGGGRDSQNKKPGAPRDNSAGLTGLNLIRYDRPSSSELKSWWKKQGEPLDSDQLYQMLLKWDTRRLNREQINSAYKELGIPLPATDDADSGTSSDQEVSTKSPKKGKKRQQKKSSKASRRSRKNTTVNENFLPGTERFSVHDSVNSIADQELHLLQLHMQRLLRPEK